MPPARGAQRLRQAGNAILSVRRMQAPSVATVMRMDSADSVVDASADLTSELEHQAAQPGCVAQRPQVGADLDRLAMRLDGFEMYAFLASLISGSAYGCLSEFEDMSFRSLQIFPPALAWLISFAFALSLTLSILSSLYATCIFALCSLYSKTALAEMKDDRMSTFLRATAIYRTRGFRYFILSLITFALSVLFVAFLRLEISLSIPTVGFGSMLLYFGLRDVKGLLLCAAPIFAPSHTIQPAGTAQHAKGQQAGGPRLSSPPVAPVVSPPRRMTPAGAPKIGSPLAPAHASARLGAAVGMPVTIPAEQPVAPLPAAAQQPSTAEQPVLQTEHATIDATSLARASAAAAMAVAASVTRKHVSEVELTRMEERAGIEARAETHLADEMRRNAPRCTEMHLAAVRSRAEAEAVASAEAVVVAAAHARALAEAEAEAHRHADAHAEAEAKAQAAAHELAAVEAAMEAQRQEAAKVAAQAAAHVAALVKEVQESTAARLHAEAKSAALEQLVEIQISAPRSVGQRMEQQPDARLVWVDERASEHGRLRPVCASPYASPAAVAGSSSTADDWMPLGSVDYASEMHALKARGGRPVHQRFALRSTPSPPWPQTPVEMTRDRDGLHYRGARASRERVRATASSGAYWHTTPSRGAASHAARVSRSPPLRS